MIYNSELNLSISTVCPKSTLFMISYWTARTLQSTEHNASYWIPWTVQRECRQSRKLSTGFLCSHPAGDSFMGFSLDAKCWEHSLTPHQLCTESTSPSIWSAFANNSTLRFSRSRVRVARRSNSKLMKSLIAPSFHTVDDGAAWLRHRILYSNYLDFMILLERATGV